MSRRPRFLGGTTAVARNGSADALDGASSQVSYSFFTECRNQYTLDEQLGRKPSGAARSRGPIPRSALRAITGSNRQATGVRLQGPADRQGRRSVRSSSRPLRTLEALCEPGARDHAPAPRKIQVPSTDGGRPPGPMANRPCGMILRFNLNKAKSRDQAASCQEYAKQKIGDVMIQRPGDWSAQRGRPSKPEREERTTARPRQIRAAIGVAVPGRIGIGRPDFSWTKAWGSMPRL